MRVYRCRSGQPTPESSGGRRIGTDTPSEEVSSVAYTGQIGPPLRFSAARFMTVHNACSVIDSISIPGVRTMTDSSGAISDSMLRIGTCTALTVGDLEPANSRTAYRRLQSPCFPHGQPASASTPDSPIAPRRHQTRDTSGRDHKTPCCPGREAHLRRSHEQIPRARAVKEL